MSAHSDRLADVVAATVEVAAESGHAGAFTDEVAQALTAVVGKVAARVTDDAERDGFVSGWQEAVQTMEAEGGAAHARVFRIHQAED
ncbi:hypothetical protein [Streptomyces huiliensis]|uniref:hypothetical protein n=1 Tax=Streptomyces huiliensis TaxID=2876027 RepID=UPI001CBAA9B9|nr:hypothetical protein [Streptomyces huiliensis]MBZ4320604.1 hypothetical protein [Streptomyces huiliensis]